MAKIEIPPQKVVRLRLAPGSPEVVGRVLSSDGETLLVEMPEELSPPDEPVVIDFVANNYFLRGETAIKATYGRWWFLTLPEEEACERVQRRTFVRIFFDGSAVAMPVTAAGEPNGEMTTVQIANLSADGCYAYSEADFDSGDHLMVFLTIPGLPTTSMICRVVRARREERGGWYGLRFDGIPSAFQEELAAFIDREIALNAQLGRDITSPVG